MELEKIDEVTADSLICGDIIKITQGYREIHSFEDFSTHIEIVTDNGEELSLDPDARISLYAYLS